MEYDRTLLQKLTPAKIADKLEAEVRKLFAPALIKRSPLLGRTFTLWGETYPYFVHRHNQTWRNERSVEIAIARRFVADNEGPGLEFGNVLSHYGRVGWTVVDKYETHCSGVLNVDIIDFQPNRPFHWIVSISTLEHVGWDERPRDTEKCVRAFQHLRSMLQSNGRMLLTVPLGHNPAMDEAIAAGLPTVREATMVRESDGWTEHQAPQWRPYLGQGRGAGAVWIGIVAGMA